MPTDWVLVTGASSGIGLELAKVFAAHKHSLVLIARDRARLSELAEQLKREHAVETLVMPKDLSAPNAASEIFSELQRQAVPVSILVNNAGFGLAGLFAQNKLQTYLEIIQVNVTALVELTHLFVQPMLARHEGKILNVASTAAFQPGPLMAIYYASKAFVFSFSYALAEELAGTGVTVTTVCPGPTHSNFHARAGTTGSERVYSKWMMESGEVAHLSYRALMRGKRVLVPGLMNKIGVAGAKCMPAFIPAKIAKKING